MRTEESQQRDLTEILALCSNGIHVLGSNNFKVALNKLITSHEIEYSQHNLFIDYIFDCVIKEWDDYKWKKDDFLKPNQRGEIIVARNIVIVLIRIHIKLTYGDIAKCLGLQHKQTITKIMREHRDMDEKNRFDALLLEKYERLNLKVLAYINNLKQQAHGG